MYSLFTDTAYANRESQWFHFNDEYVTKVTQCSERTVTVRKPSIMMSVNVNGILGSH